MSTRFAIVCMGRTGSSLLVNLLNSHPDIECQGELFRPATAFSKFPGMSRREFLEKHAYEGDLPIRGFKMPFDWILDHPCIFDDFRHLGYKILRLNRRNALSHFVSIKLAQLNNNWGSRHPYSIGKTSVDAVELYQFIGSRHSCNTVLDRFSAPLECITLHYETIMAPQSHADVLQFLGARPHALTTDTIKQRSRPLAEAIENIAELELALGQTRMAELMKD